MAKFNKCFILSLLTLAYTDWKNIGLPFWLNCLPYFKLIKVVNYPNLVSFVYIKYNKFTMVMYFHCTELFYMPFKPF